MYRILEYQLLQTFKAENKKISFRALHYRTDYL